MADEFNASQSAGTFSSRQQVKDNRGNVVGNLIQQASFEIGQLTIYQGQVTQVPDSGREKTTEHKAIAPNPYKGLAAFQETDGDRFFGREQHILTLWRQLRDLFEVEGAIRLLPIYGPSGSGKSSLARAGLIPVLARQPLPGYEQARVAVLTPGTHPLESLAAVLARIATQDLTPIGKAAEFAEALKRRDEKGDYDGLRRIADILPEITASPLIVVVDQFEEVYSLCKDAVERAAFVENLLTAAAERTRRVAVIITLRSDFLEETQQSGTLNKVFSKQGFLVPMMDRSELRQAIAVPAELAGYGFDEATIGLLIEQAEGREGALPLLQFALTRIWEGLGEGQVPAVMLQAIGGVGGALAGEAQRIYENLVETEQGIARRVFVGLVQLGEGTKDTRRRVAIERLVTCGEAVEQVMRVVDRFAMPGARLITLSEADGKETVEVTHEALFEHWVLLNEWLDSSREDIRFQRRLEVVVKDWKERGFPEGSLWRRPDLDLLKSFQQRVGEDMTPLQVSFYRRAVRAELKRKVVSGVSIGALIVMSGVTSLLAISSQRAQRRTFASQLATRAEAIGNQQTTAHTISSLLAVQASKVFENDTNPPLEIDQALRGGLRQLPSLIYQFDHVGPVRAASFSPDGQIVATASEDRTVRLWDINTGEKLATLNHEGAVHTVSFSPDGRTVATASNDSSARLWNVKTGDKLATLRHNWGGVPEVSFSLDGKMVATAGFDSTARLWEVETGKELIAFKHEGPVKAVSFSPDGQMVATAPLNDTARLWDVKTGEELFVFNHDGPVTSVSFSPNGQTVATTHYGDPSIQLWDVETREELVAFNHAGPVQTVSFSPDGRMIATASFGGTAMIWDLHVRESLAILRHEGGVNSVRFSPDGQTVATTSSDNTARLWDVKNGEELVSFRHEGGVNSVRFSPDGQMVVTTSSDNTARLWSKAIKEELAILNHTDDVHTVSFSHDGQTIITVSKDRTIRLWDVDNGEELATLNHERYMGFSPNERWKISSISEDRTTVWLWDIRSGEKLVTINNASFINDLDFSYDGQTIATASRDNLIRLWDAKNGEELVVLNHEVSISGSSIYGLSFSPDGQMIATTEETVGNTSRDNLIRLWDAKNGEELIVLNHKGRVWDINFSPDSQIVATASDDNTVQLWDTKSGKELVTFNHEGTVNAVIFSPDGQILSTITDGRAARLWNVENGKELATLTHEGTVNSVSFSPDGQIVATASDDNTVQLWYRSPWKMRDIICRRISRNLTALEWESYLNLDLSQYDLVCPNRPVHPSVLEFGRQYAKSNRLKKAVAIFRRVQKLYPNIDLDPLTEVQEKKPKILAQRILHETQVKEKMQAARDLAERGKIDAATHLYSEAQKIFPDVDLDPDTEALDDNPKTTALKVGASVKLESARKLAKEGDIYQAIKIYQDIQQDIEITTGEWNTLCWFGSLHGHAIDVMFACEKAVRMAPGDGAIRDSRGLAKALTGDVKGAIEDFHAFANESQGPESRQRKDWIQTLKAGKDPFTDKVLKSLLEK